MPELIDRNELRRRIYERFGQYSTKVIATVEEGKIIEDWAFLEPFLNAAPTIEAEPVRHGQWIAKLPYEDETVKDLEFQIVCSRCDEQNSSIEFDENSVPIAKTFYQTRYCPNCGAKMDEPPESEVQEDA